jgi:aryl-alcohol dehydrogenase-like predicted oxidoreductase
MKAGLCRYVGITTSQVRSYDAMAKVLTREKPDFLQVNYSLGALESEKTLLPAARDAAAAVLVRQAGVHARQPRCRPRPAAGRGDAQENGSVLGFARLTRILSA